jgi:DNA polymerase
VRSLSIDFETRSVVDLRSTGVYPYAQDPTTDIWCMSYAFDDDGVIKTWAPRYPYQTGDGEWRWHTLEFPDEVRAHVEAGGTIRAHNAQFERLIWREILEPRYGAPTAALEQFECSAAEAAEMGLPRNLAGVASVLGAETQKDMEGHNLMMRMCRPRSQKGSTVTWWDVPDRVARLIAYCENDVRTEQAISKSLRRLTPKERELYLLDQRINDRGITLDIHLCKQAKTLAAVNIERSTAAIHELTGGKVEKLSQNARMLEWLRGQGMETDSIDKHAVAAMQAREDLDPKIEAFLQLRAEGAKTSVAKIESMLQCVGGDGRMRGLLMFFGAHTGRWSGRLVQPHNFPKGKVANAEEYIPLVLKGARGYDELDLLEVPMEVLSSLLRPMMTAGPGRELVAADFVGIESRVLAWLAGDKAKVARMLSGKDEYKRLAAQIYGIREEDVTKAQRQFGKVGELGCGYGMGAAKLIDTAAKQFGVTMTEDEAALVVHTYRSMNTEVIDLWYNLEAAARRAVVNPGTTVQVGPLKFSKRGAYLWVILPSGRPMAYPSPRIIERETPWGEKRPSLECWGVNGYTRKWESYDLYGGLWAENVVQAISRDLLAEAMLRLDGADYPVILSVHDEIVSEVPLGAGSLDEFLEVMTALPSWAAGCPVSAEGWRGVRYRK